MQSLSFSWKIKSPSLYFSMFLVLFLFLNSHRVLAVGAEASAENGAASSLVGDVAGDNQSSGMSTDCTTEELTEYFKISTAKIRKTPAISSYKEDFIDAYRAQKSAAGEGDCLDAIFGKAKDFGSDILDTIMGVVDKIKGVWNMLSGLANKSGDDIAFDMKKFAEDMWNSLKEGVCGRGSSGDGLGSMVGKELGKMVSKEIKSQERAALSQIKNNAWVSKLNEYSDVVGDTEAYMSAYIGLDGTTSSRDRRIISDDAREISKKMYNKLMEMR